ncbi:Tumor necrosis factor receptor superfamily member 18 [Labeo rohita]|uniref:Tumor necrosis factor receptor superfamily member 18 n=1 Tax=Labeo rohita TaxID=84645 RepID=A0ABQ8MLP1_LABRO|nr:Tumor necrosis factor receptor superfamily member 18 [Labeo rohita]
MLWNTSSQTRTKAQSRLTACLCVFSVSVLGTLVLAFSLSCVARLCFVGERSSVTVDLWFTLLCFCNIWILCLAIRCDWTKEYAYNNKCCKACPSGEYPKEPCSDMCQKCSTAFSAKDKCFCKDNHVCSNDKCESCNPRERCKPGHQLIRNGAFEYTYYCEQCSDNTYSDAEDSICKPITKCVGGEIFAGNRTHNARCASSVHPAKEEKQESHTIDYLMVASLAITLLTCMIFIMYTAFKFFRYKMLRKISKQCTHNCKLSKEEEGEEDDSKSEISEVPFKHDLYSFP